VTAGDDIFTVDGVPMGNEAARPRGAKLPVRLRVWGTELLLRVEILRWRQGIDRAFRHDKRCADLKIRVMVLDLLG